MTTLTVWKFDSESGARGALQVLERLQKEELLQVVDAAIVTWPPDRKKPKTEQLRSLGGAGALGGAFWGRWSQPVEAIELARRSVKTSAGVR